LKNSAVLLRLKNGDRNCYRAKHKLLTDDQLYSTMIFDSYENIHKPALAD